MQRPSIASWLCATLLVTPLFATVSRAAEQPATRPALKRILFVGNSITRHGPKADIGWTGNWGMAASAMEKDYVHLLTSALAQRVKAAPEAMIENIADFERKPDAFDFKTRLAKATAFKADVIILAIGENVPALRNDDAKAAFRQHMQKLLAALRTDNNPAIFVRSSFWPDAAKDTILKAAAAEAGATFVDISALGKDPANRARSERPIAHEGVGAHPGDKGMKAIADALFNAITQRPAAP